MKRAFIGASFAGVAVAAAVLASESWALSPRGSDGILLVPLLAVIPLLLAFLGLVASLPLLLFTRSRAIAVSAGIACVTVLVLGSLGFEAAGSIRMRAFRKVAERGTPLVGSIRAFELRNGRPPKSLEELVPSDLPHIPGTGIGAYPDFEYATGPGSEAAGTGNTWVLYVPASTGALNWDIFIYYPNQRYPKEGHGGVLEPVGSWAYVSE